METCDTCRGLFDAETMCYKCQDKLPANIARAAEQERDEKRLEELEVSFEAEKQAHAETRGILRDLIQCMQLWGSWEEGIPEQGQEGTGSIWNRYAEACNLLDLDPRISLITGKAIPEATEGNTL